MSVIIDGTNGVTFPNSTIQASAGVILQVVQYTSITNNSTTGSAYVAAGLTGTITPTSSTSKILVIVNQNIYSAANSAEPVLTIYRNGADLTAGNGFADVYTGNSDLIMQMPMLYLDSPATTSSTTYAIYMKRTGSAGTIQSCLRGTTNTMILMEVAA
jgi:hypothetical protein